MKFQRRNYVKMIHNDSGCDASLKNCGDIKVNLGPSKLI